MVSARNSLILSVIILGCTFLPLSGPSQGLIDGFMKGKKNTDVAISLSLENAGTYYTGTDEITFKRNAVSTGIYAIRGIAAWLDIAMNLPLIDWQLQDGSMMVKAGKQAAIGASSLTFIGAIGGSTPLGNYPTERGTSIGQMATYINTRLLTQLQFSNHYFFHLRTGHNHSVEVTPSSTVFSFKIGYFKEKFYTDIWIENQQASGGKDYRGTGDLVPATFKELGVSYLRMGGIFYYQLKPRSGFALGYGYTFSGRNTYKYSRISVGYVYKFLAA